MRQVKRTKFWINRYGDDRAGNIHLVAFKARSLGPEQYCASPGVTKNLLGRDFWRNDWLCDAAFANGCGINMGNVGSGIGKRVVNLGIGQHDVCTRCCGTSGRVWPTIARRNEAHFG